MGNRMLLVILLILGAFMGLSACGTVPSSADSQKEQQAKEPVGNTETLVETGKADQQENSEESAVSDFLEPYVLVREICEENMPQTLYDYNERGDLERIQQFYDRGEGLVLEYVQEYRNEYLDNGGRITVRAKKMVENNVPEANAIWEYEEEYDGQNRLVRKTTIQDGQFAGEEVKYEYNEEGHMISKTGQDTETAGSELPETYEYDADGNQIRRTVLNEDGSVNGWWEFYYDENRRLILEEQYKPDGTLVNEQPEMVWEYEYDNQGRIIAETERTKSGSGIIQRFTYEYDGQGGLRKKTDETYDVIYEYLPLSEYMQNRQAAE